ncbi:MAG: hypothetical protein H0W39_02020 [Sphingomonas sp.]|nr:hypothetical protein [Sphingomonas sp.]
MTTGSIIEVAVAVAMIVAGIYLYRRRSPDRYGSQSAVLLFLIAAIMLMHGLGFFEYRPSPAEISQ